MKIGEMKFNNDKKCPDSLDFSLTEKLIFERNKSVDSAVIMEIQKIAVEGGIETKFILNERNILNALKKQMPQKPLLDTIFPSGVEWYRCPSCLHNGIEKTSNYCHCCGQLLNWAE